MLTSAPYSRCVASNCAIESAYKGGAPCRNALQTARPAAVMRGSSSSSSASGSRRDHGPFSPRASQDSATRLRQMEVQGLQLLTGSGAPAQHADVIGCGHAN